MFNDPGGRHKLRPRTMLDWQEASTCLRALLERSQLFKGCKGSSYSILWLVRTLLVPLPQPS